MALKFQGLDHIALRVSDLQRSKAFYVGVLGFQAIRETNNLVLMFAHGSLIGILGNAPQTPRGEQFNPYRVGVDHLALRVSSRKELERLKQQLDAAGIKNNGVEEDKPSNAFAITFYDPDGIAWEFYVLPRTIKLFLRLAGIFNLKIPQQK